jgi:uncharacterized protein YndB with AHSA1/START domain
MPGDRIIGGLDIDTYTSAPLRVMRTAYLDASPARVFAVISDHANADTWMPLVTQVNVSRGHADARDGVGTIRYLHAGFWYSMRQYIIAFNPPRLMAYSIEQDPLITHHVSVMYLEPERYGGTVLFWQHYFRTSLMSFVTVPLVSILFDQSCAFALRKLISHFGGEMR